jgi:hypothetical protein
MRGRDKEEIGLGKWRGQELGNLCTALYSVIIQARKMRCRYEPGIFLWVRWRGRGEVR